MPAPVANVLANLVKTPFRAKSIKVPSGYKGFSDQWPQTQQSSDHDPAGVAASAMWLFKPQTSYRGHVDQAKHLHDVFSDFIDRMSAGICQAWSQQHSAAKFVAILINGPVGVGTPGCLIPPLMNGPLILGMTNLAGVPPPFVKYAKTISTVFGTAFTTWMTGYMIPTISFPGGSVCSVTMIPSPNIPQPLAAGQSAGEPMLQAAALKGQMVMQHADNAPYSTDLFDSFSQGLNQVFTQWKASTMITNVMGAGGAAPPPPAPPAPVVAALGNGGMLT